MTKKTPLLLLLLVGAFFIVSCAKEDAQPPPPPPVETMTLSAADVPVFSEWVGQTRGSVNTEIRARVEGFLDKVTFDEGRHITKGTVMYHIDPLEYIAYLNKAKGELAESQANLARATQDVVRYKPLVEQNAISREEYETSVQMERAATASVDAAQAAVQKARLDLGYCTVVAPISGLAGKTEVQIGNLVGRDGSTLLTTISKTDPIRVRFSLSERDLLDFRRRASVKDNSKAARQMDLFLVLADGSKYEYPGRLVLADNRVDARTGTLLLEAEFPNPEKLLQPGQFARVRSVTDMRTNVVVIPQRAVSELQGQARVVVLKDNKVMFRNIDLGPRVGSAYVVNSGLEVGETIIIEGLQRIREGIQVKATHKQVDIDSLVNRS